MEIGGQGEGNDKPGIKVKVVDDGGITQRNGSVVSNEVGNTRSGLFFFF